RAKTCRDTCILVPESRIEQTNLSGCQTDLQRGLDEGIIQKGHMPLYFFHLNFGHRVLPDEEGVELPNRRPRGGVGSRTRLGRSQDRRQYEALGELVLAGGRRWGSIVSSAPV